MTQKDKVKELVGRGLNSYHTKSLQQIDRIEKKNKEQNHKISILTNELDNDYLTKTEEGSVVSLDHSKEGMVYLDELQGNTLVNYCTDGSKELTLNGDIDVEGIFITTTEGVDNGKVDVLCEGNTLVNLVNRYDYHANQYSHVCFFKGGMLKPSTKYSAIITNPSTEDLRLYWNEGIFDYVEISIPANSTKVFTHTTKTEMNIDRDYTLFKNAKTHTQAIQFKVICLEGDWTNKELPASYFKGMQSVGQDDENGHKIEILSQSKNLLRNTSLSSNEDWLTFQGTIVDGINGNKAIHSTYEDTEHGYYDFLQQHIYDEKDKKKCLIKEDTWYTLSFYAKGVGGCKTYIYPSTIDTNNYGIVDGESKPLHGDGHCDWNLTDEWVRHSFTFKTRKVITHKNKTQQVLFRLMPNDQILNSAMISCVMLEEGKVATNFVNDSSNKKEISLNEPLRGLLNGVKDKIVKIDGKWYIQRNTGQILLNGDSNEKWVFEPDWTSNSGELSRFLISIPNQKYILWHDLMRESKNYSINNRFNALENIAETFALEVEHFTGWDLGKFVLNIKTSRLSIKNESGLKQWLSENPIELVYELETPTYEEIPIDPTLNTYNDITHISNNSTIPCNMKIKNTGYNAIIKPSTQYTVALDTNKSGTIGMNLSGANVTTTNNVATITTPATLTDDSLRLYGKGIKGSKVRLLEGDKTNWIPSHFEGMQSSFEDKFDATDNTYKMEILSNNENLLDLNSKAYKTNFSYDRLIYRSDTNSLVSDIEIGEKIKFKITQHPTYGLAFLIKTIPNKKYTISAKGKCIGGTKQNEVDYFTLAFKTDIDSIETWKNMPQPTDFLREYANIKNVPINTKGSLTFVAKSNYSLVGFCSTYRDWNPSDIPSNDTAIFEFEDIMVTENENVKDFIEHKHNKIQFSSIEPLRSLPNGVKDKFIFKDGKLMIERNTSKSKVNNIENVNKSYDGWNNIVFAYKVEGLISAGVSIRNVWSNLLPSRDIADLCNTLGKTGIASHDWGDEKLQIAIKGINTVEKMKEWISKNDLEIVYQIEPTYEEIPFELQKIILEVYENGTLFIDTNIPPTSTVTYAGETSIVKATKLNKTEVLNNTNDINDNIVPYLMDMDYRVVCLQLQSENINDGVSMARLFGGTYEMLQRDILSKRYSVEEYKYRLDDYLSVNKITEKEYEELGEMLNE